jgi:DNA segregation ATPase FtsK/SpoIIIE, S-DNA-T family
MAEKKKASDNKTKAKTSKVGSKKGDPSGPEKTKIIFGLLIAAFTIYLFMSFVSFLFSADADQSKLQMKWLELIKNPEIKVENITGKTGAYLSDVLINRCFGLASFIFIYLLSIYSLKLLNRRITALLTKTFKALTLLLWLSVTLGFAFEWRYDTSSIYPGGTYGYFIAIWLDSMIGKVGTFFVLLVTLLIYLVVAVENFIHIFKYTPKPKPVKAITAVKKEEIVDEDDEEDDEDIIDEEDDYEDEKPVITKNNEREISENKPKRKGLFSRKPKEEKAEPEIEIIEREDEDEFFVNPPRIEKPITEVNEKPILSTVGDDEAGIFIENDSTFEEEEEYENQPLDDYDPTLDLSRYAYPSIDLLEDYSHLKSEVSDEELIENKNKIVETLKNFKIEIVKIKATIGPTVTLYEIVPAQGIRISKIKNLEDDIALSLSALGIRIIAPIPGRGTIGIEVPNRQPQVVSMRSIISSKKFLETVAELPIAMGRTISNETFVFDLTKMPHLLVAGATGQGKSVGLNAIIASILFKKHPSQVKFVFIDPKKVELNLYSSIEKHFLAKLPNLEEPIITDVEHVKATLTSIGIEMDARYDLLKSAHARNVKEYNKKFIQRKLNPEKGHRYLPYIVVVIDEFADLIMTAGKEIEFPIARIAQLARAIGIHMVIATQRPSTNIITGVIKANFPSRIAFKVASMIDSRTILDQPGANQLIGKGDMLFSAGSEVIRLQCALVDTPEVERICEHIAAQQSYPTAYLLPEFVGDESDMSGIIDLNQKDEFFDDAARLIVMNQQGSTSMIQRKFSIGYNRAGRIMDQLEAAGIVGPSEGSKARRVLYQDEYSLEQLLKSL